MTGEGQTVPAGVNGKVTVAVSEQPITPLPVLPVSVMIDGEPAIVAFAGEAPGLVSGVLQVNTQIPLNARSGNVPLVVSVGNSSSQAGITVSAK